ncbi:MAG: carboxypeptidase-like regulatory domain-containing protein [Bacteroidota bacterium]
MRRNLNKLYSFTIILFLLIILSGQQVNAQTGSNNKEVVQFTGIVVSSDGITTVPGVHIYVPKSGRGTTTNFNGYFSMAALVDDEVMISAVGFMKQKYIIPEGNNNRVNVLFKLKEDTLYLQNVDILPFPSEREFKEVILAMKMPEENKVLEDRLDGASLSLLLQSTPYDASLNARYYFDQQFYYMQDQYGPRTNPFLNPFNWSRFIQSLKKKK